MSQLEDSSPYQLTTSIRYDRNLRVDDDDTDGPVPFLLLRYHYERLSDAAARHGWDDAKAALSYDYLKSTCEHAIQAHDVPANQRRVCATLAPYTTDKRSEPSQRTTHRSVCC